MVNHLKQGFSAVAIESGSIVGKANGSKDMVKIELFNQVAVHGIFPKLERRIVPFCVGDIEVFAIGSYAAEFFGDFKLFQELPFGIGAVPCKVHAAAVWVVGFGGIICCEGTNGIMAEMGLDTNGVGPNRKGV